MCKIYKITIAKKYEKVLSRNTEGKKHADPCTGRAGA
jgi:hypothetical protein